MHPKCIPVETTFSVTKPGVIDKGIITYKAESEDAQGWITMFLKMSREWHYPYPLEEHYVNAAYQVYHDLQEYVR